MAPHPPNPAKVCGQSTSGARSASTQATSQSVTRKVVVQQNELLDKRLAAGESIFVGSTDVEEGAA